jgi:hypothetical protein
MDAASLRELQKAADRSAIAQVLGLYCRAIDRLDVELLRSVYHPDGVDDHGAMCLNAHEFAEKIIEMLGAACVNTMHTVTHSVIEVDGDRAAAESYYLAAHTIAADETAVEKWFGPTYAQEQRAAGRLGLRHEYLCYGRYLDELHRRQGEWKIYKRRITLEWGVCRPESIVSEGVPASFAVEGRRDREDPVYKLLRG